MIFWNGMYFMCVCVWGGGGGFMDRSDKSKLNYGRYFSVFFSRYFSCSEERYHPQCAKTGGGGAVSFQGKPIMPGLGGQI